MNNLTTKTKLFCSIVATDYSGRGPNMKYVVTDQDGIIVADGISSSEAWVRYDAGGYHTQREFDKMFPEGWEVEFDF